MLTAAELEARRSGIGASDIAAVMGRSRWRCALDIYLEKVDVSPARHDKKGPGIEWGNRHEPAIAQKYQDEHPGIRLARWDMQRHSRHPWMLCTPDRIAYSQCGEVRYGVELKTADEHARSEWGPPPDGKVPVEYLLQCQWSMLVTGMIRWDLAVLIGKSDYREYEMEAHEGLHDTMFKAAHRFWHKHVLQEIPPPPDASKACGRALSTLHGFDTDKMRAGTGDTDALAEDYRAAVLAVQMAADRKEKVVNQIKDTIGPYGGIKGPWYTFKWTPNKKGVRSFRATLKEQANG